MLKYFIIRFWLKNSPIWWWTTFLKWKRLFMLYFPVKFSPRRLLFCCVPEEKPPNCEKWSLMLPLPRSIYGKLRFFVASMFRAAFFWCWLLCNFAKLQISSWQAVEFWIEQLKQFHAVLIIRGYFWTSCERRLPDPTLDWFLLKKASSIMKTASKETFDLKHCIISAFQNELGAL